VKNIFKDLFKKKDSISGGTEDLTTEKKNKVISFFNNVKSKITTRLGKTTAQGEKVLGVELTSKEIRLAEISLKDNSCSLENLHLHKIELPEDATVLDNLDLLTDQLKIALQDSKIKTNNAAFSIPVTSAIIRVVSCPVMSDEELASAAETGTLWENLVQLTDNLNDYSIFHQVISRNEKENTMDILFVASKLSDINSYSSIIRESGLNPAIIDVKCFSIKTAVDQASKLSSQQEDPSLTAILEFGTDENYVMILHENNPIITDIFIRSQDRKTLKDSDNQEEMDLFIRRYVTQVKQAINDFESKYEKRIRNLKIISDLENIETYLGAFRKNMVNTGFSLFNPLENINVSENLKEKINSKNISYLSTVIGLAFRKLDIFEKNKSTVAVKNINLLPERVSMVAGKKMKIFSNYIFKIAASLLGVIFILLIGASLMKISSYNSKLEENDQVTKKHETLNKKVNEIAKEFNLMDKTLKLSKSIKSNKIISYRILAQIATSVPNRVQFSGINYDGKSKIIIQGSATNDQDILKLIANLNTKSLIEQASLATMTLPSSSSGSNKVRKGFKILVNIKKK
jgi:type IV pilus assembly protein PilN